MDLRDGATNRNNAQDSGVTQDVWQLGDAVADLAAQRVRRDDGGETRLTPRATAVLRALIESGDRPLSRDALLARVWAAAETGDEVVSKAVNELRLALGDHDTRRRRYIETIPKLGYRLICACQPLAAAPTPAPSSPHHDRADLVEGSRRDDDPSIGSDEPAVATADAAPEATAAALMAPAPAGSHRARVAIVAALLGVAAVALWFAPLRSGPRSAYPADALRVALSAQPRLVAEPRDYLGYVDVLPDGSGALHAAPLDGTVRVVARTLDGGAVTRIGTLPDGADFAPAVSHDGRLIAYQHFADGTCRIRVHDTRNASERDLAGCSSRFAEWLEFSPDGTFLLTPRMRPGDTAMSLHRIDLRDGATQPWDYPRDPAASDVQARWSPDGRLLAIRRGAQPHSALLVFDPARGTIRELVDDGLGLDGFAWLPDGRGLVIGVHDGEAAGLWRVDAANGERDYLGLRGATCPAIARDATLLFTQSQRRLALMRPALDGRAEAEPPQPFATAIGAEWYPRASADGRHLAFLSDRDGPIAVYVDGGGTLVRLPDLPGHLPHATPAPTADAQRVLAIMRAANGRSALYETPLASPAWRRVGATDVDIDEVLVSPDDRWIYYVARDAGGVRSLWRRSRETGAEQRLADGLARGPIAADRKGGIFYVDVARQALLRRDPDDGRIEPWLDDMGYWTAYAWTLGPDGVYALREPAGKDFGLYRIAAAGSAPVLVEPMDGISPLGLAMTGDGTLTIARPPHAAQRLMTATLNAASDRTGRP